MKASINFECQEQVIIFLRVEGESIKTFPVKLYMFVLYMTNTELVSRKIKEKRFAKS